MSSVGVWCMELLLESLWYDCCQLHLLAKKTLWCLSIQTEAGGSPGPMGPSAPLSEGPPQQPAQGAGQCTQLGLGHHGTHPLPAPPLATSAPCHCAGAARLQVRTVPNTHSVNSAAVLPLWILMVFHFLRCKINKTKMNSLIINLAFSKFWVYRMFRVEELDLIMCCWIDSNVLVCADLQIQRWGAWLLAGLKRAVMMNLLATCHSLYR